MKTKRILFATYDLPFSKDTGDSIYTMNILEGLVNLGYRVDMLYYNSLVISEDRMKLFRSMGIYCYSVRFISRPKLGLILSKNPGMVANRKSKEYLDEFKRLVTYESYSFVFINHLKMSFIIGLYRRLKVQSKLVYVAHNAEYLLSKNNAKNTGSLVRKMLFWQDSIKTKIYEKKWLRFVDGITAISEHDLEYYNDLICKKNGAVIRPVFESQSKVKVQRKSIKEIILVGSFQWSPKIENMRSFLNASNFGLLAENGIMLTIVGNADPRLVEEVNSTYEGVHMTGRVKSVAPYYERSKIAVVPETLGGGFKLKVAEAAMNKSAIFSLRGAITRCNLKKDMHFIEEENSFDLINKIIQYQNRQLELDVMIQNAFSIASKDYSLESLENNISSFMEKL